MCARFPALLMVACLVLSVMVPARAAPAPFDLTGPTIEVTVTRGLVTLPIAEVPNLAPGDRLWIKADLPPNQSAKYLLVAAFLSGATNPPPSDWFFRSRTWDRREAQQGLSMAVPPDARQVLLFLAPETGGDFKTLVDTVRGRPGAFVRASQDLNQATLDRSRLVSYLASVRALDQFDQSRLREAAPLLARSLAIKVDEKCLDRIAELQAPCLMQSQDSLILNDGHSTSIVEALTSGPASDLALEASNTPQLNYGYYSPYLASVLDIARIFDSFHIAQYQYIPALSSLSGDRLQLTLNSPPSFHNPKSVLVVALPAVETARLPPLHAVDPKEIYCAGKTSPVIPVEGAPLVFSTAFAHDMMLSLTGSDGKTINLPAKADAERGGFVVDTSGLATAALGDSIRGQLHGSWGFDEYNGPHFQLVNARSQSWGLATGDEGAVIVGRENTVHLQTGSVSCIERIMLKDSAGKELKTEWKVVKPNEVELKLPLQETQPGAVTLLVTQYGASQPQLVPLQAFSEAGHPDKFTIHSGDSQGILKGSRLDEIASLTLKNTKFVPAPPGPNQNSDELLMAVEVGSAAPGLKSDDTAKAKVALMDGRVFEVAVVVGAPRPQVALIAKNVQLAPSNSGSNIQLANQDELPQDATLTFSVRALSPTAFASDVKIEVATTDESLAGTLSRRNGELILEDRAIIVATLDPAKVFGQSAFGALQFRVVMANATSDWQPLAKLVRLPVLKDLTCPAAPVLVCKLSGSNLFLLDSISSDAQFEHPVRIPDGFPGEVLPVARPADGHLYVKLHDDPLVINTATLIATTAQQTSSPAPAASSP